jgi:hypothetical protein
LARGATAHRDRAPRMGGRIAIANSDSGAYAFAHSAIDQATRAVRELLGVPEAAPAYARFPGPPLEKIGMEEYASRPAGGAYGAASFYVLRPVKAELCAREAGGQRPIIINSYHVSEKSKYRSVAPHTITANVAITKAAGRPAAFDALLAAAENAREIEDGWSAIVSFALPLQ